MRNRLLTGVSSGTMALGVEMPETHSGYLPADGICLYAVTGWVILWISSGIGISAGEMHGRPRKWRLENGRDDHIAE